MEEKFWNILILTCGVGLILCPLPPQLSVCWMSEIFFLHEHVNHCSWKWSQLNESMLLPHFSPLYKPTWALSMLCLQAPTLCPDCYFCTWCFFITFWPSSAYIFKTVFCEVHSFDLLRISFLAVYPTLVCISLFGPSCSTSLCFLSVTLLLCPTHPSSSFMLSEKMQLDCLWNPSSPHSRNLPLVGCLCFYNGGL